MTQIKSRQADMAEELTIDTATISGTPSVIGVLAENPVMIVFDNQSTTSVGISNSTDFVWRTFPPGEGIILDMVANKGLADTFTFKVGTTIYATGTAGVGNFSVSFIFATVAP